MEFEALEMYADLGYQQSYFAWLYWGAAYPDLYLGEYKSARNQANYAMEIFNDVKHYFANEWIAGTKDILGRAALAERAYAEAENWFFEIKPVYEECRYPLDMANYGQNLVFLGFAKRGLDQISKARVYFYKALGVAAENESYLAVYHILPGIALLFADQGDIERAVELYALAATQGIVANSKWFDDIAGDEIAAPAEELPPDIVEAAKARGRVLDLWETAKALLAELEVQGWGEGQVSYGDAENK
jgi:tetratricopeptide (TPR) repeat protein